MRFVFLRSELCRRLPSDSALRRTPLPLANGRCYQPHSGLAPPSYRPCRAHLIKVPRPIFRAGEVIYLTILFSVPASEACAPTCEIMLEGSEACAPTPLGVYVRLEPARSAGYSRSRIACAACERNSTSTENNTRSVSGNTRVSSAACQTR